MAYDICISAAQAGEECDEVQACGAGDVQAAAEQPGVADWSVGWKTCVEGWR